MKKLTTLLVLAGLLLSAQTASATYYPNDGSFYYSGDTYADSYFRWTAPGPWSHGDVGYEHDLEVNFPDWANACNAWTNLPYGYDDCVTFGQSETGMATGSFGSYHINNVAANTTYMGWWDFYQEPSNPPTGSTPANLLGEENEHRLCGGDSPWCMLSIREQYLLAGFTLTVGTARYIEW